MNTAPFRLRFPALAAAALSMTAAALPAAAQGCPGLGWSEGLKKYLPVTAQIPVDDTKPIPTPDCNFHEWSWEAFVWATAPINGAPRFLSLPTPDDLLSKTPAPHKLKLAARTLMAHAPGMSEGAGAFVQADGSVLVGPNGYPVLASVHMNPFYFTTAQQNLIVNGGYNNQPADSYFPVGAAVFKATWMRLGPGEAAPKGAYTTEAQVPELSVLRTMKSYSVVPSGKFVNATVALVGLHVVGYTVNHPEFLWATFEHNLNSPATPDNTFSTAGSSPSNFTFYAANTPYTKVNQQNPPAQGQSFTPPQLMFNPVTQKFSPANPVVQENATGGENQTGGPANIAALNGQGQSFLTGQKSAFANYHLVGTVWMLPNTYVLPAALKLNQTNAVGSVTLANTTAETFVQTPKNSPITQVLNCFLCHNATSYNFHTPPPDKLASRRIAISHVLGFDTPYAVPNMITVPIQIAPGTGTAVHRR